MPPYFATTGLTRVQTAYVGKTILLVRDVEYLVAYLVSLQGRIKRRTISQAVSWMSLAD